MIKFNQSLIKAFDCPARGKFLMEADKLFPADGPGLTGQALHRFAEKYITHLHKGGLETDPSFYEQIIPVAAEYPTYLDIRDYEYLCSQFLKFFSVDYNKDICEFGIEQTISSTRHGVPGVTMIGRPDYWINYGPEGSMVDLWDWKTTRRLWTQSECEANIQLKYYALLISKLLDNQPRFYNLAYYFPRHQEVREFTITRDDLEVFEDYIVNKIKVILGLTEWPERPNPDTCMYCECWDNCREIDDDLADSIYVAGEWVKLKKKTAEYAKILKTMVETGGPVELDGQILDFYTTESDHLFDMPGIIKTMREAGCENFEISSARLTTSAIKKACGRYKGLYDEILGKHSEVVKGTRFEFRKFNKEKV